MPDPDPAVVGSNWTLMLPRSTQAAPRSPPGLPHSRKILPPTFDPDNPKLSGVGGSARVATTVLQGVGLTGILALVYDNKLRAQ